MALDPSQIRNLMRRSAAGQGREAPTSPPPQKVAPPQAEPAMRPAQSPVQGPKPAPVVSPKAEENPAQAPAAPPAESLKTASVTIVPPAPAAPQATKAPEAPGAREDRPDFPTGHDVSAVIEGLANGSGSPKPAASAPQAAQPLIPNLDLSAILGGSGAAQASVAPQAAPPAPVTIVPPAPAAPQAAEAPAAGPTDLSARLEAVIGPVTGDAREIPREAQQAAAPAVPGPQKYVAERPAALPPAAKRPKAPSKAGAFARRHAFSLTLGGFTAAYWAVSNVFVPEVGQVVNSSGLPQFLKTHLYPLIIPCAMAALTAWSFFTGKGKENITKGRSTAPEAKG